MAQQNPSDMVRQASTLSIVWGVLLVALGVLAVGSPLVAAVAVNVVISWLIVVAGIVHLAVAFHRREVGSIILADTGRARLCFLWRVLDRASSNRRGVAHFGAGITFSG